MKAATFYHNGLGDGVNGLVLSHNLSINGWEVDTYQNVMGGMQRWFSHVPILPYPRIDALPSILEKYDRYFVVHNDTCPFVLQLIREGKKRYPDRLKVIYLYPSPNIINEPYYSDCLTDPSRSVAANMVRFCDLVLHLPKQELSAGMVAPPGLVRHKYSRRIVIHPTSGRPTRNWPKDRYVKLALHLEKQGYECVFVPGSQSVGWEDVRTESFGTLDALACYLYESRYLIGNDSGLGHLASALGVPTLTVCRRKALANLWGPSLCKAVVLTPSAWIPNIGGLRWRDRYWKQFISVRQVLRGFHRLCRLQKINS
jgi:hypothetical protein